MCRRGCNHGNCKRPESFSNDGMKSKRYTCERRVLTLYCWKLLSQTMKQLLSGMRVRVCACVDQSQKHYLISICVLYGRPWQLEVLHHFANKVFLPWIWTPAVSVNLPTSAPRFWSDSSQPMNRPAGLSSMCAVSTWSCRNYSRLYLKSVCWIFPLKLFVGWKICNWNEK